MDISHPAHFHLIRNSYFALLKNGHKIFVTVKNVPSIIFLLKKYDIPYTLLESKKDSLIGKGITQIGYIFKLCKFVNTNKITLGFSSSFTMTQVSLFTKMDAVLLDDDDDEVEPLVVKYGHPFAKVVLSPECVKRKTKGLIPYKGYHELAYLHPNRFTPDESVLAELGLKKDDRYFVLRFNAFKAYHDSGIKGISIENKRKLIQFLETKGKVFITTERNIDEEFLKYQLLLSAEKVHSLIFYATMLIGDSQTMTSEAAVLGTPAIRCNSFVGRISYLEEEEHKYELTYGFRPEEVDRMFLKIEELLLLKNLKEIWAIRRAKMLSDKIDVSAFYIWFVENYPLSIEIMKGNPDFQRNFI